MHPLVTATVLGGTLIFIAKASAKKRKTPSRVSNPFADKACTKLRSMDEVRRWIDTVGFRRAKEAYDAAPVSLSDPKDKQMLLVADYVSWGLLQLPLTCTPYSTVPARRNLFKILWCAVASDLAARGKIDEETADIARACGDPTFNPLDYLPTTP